MFSDIFEVKKTKPQTFQVVFLRNDPSQAVEVLEADQVDFWNIQEHLERGESVFITSKSSQKLRTPRGKGAQKVEAKTNSRRQAFYFSHL